MENGRRHQSVFQPRSRAADMAAHSGHGEFTGASLVELLRFRAAAQPRDAAYTFLRDGEHEGDSITYEALDRLSRAVAARLQLSYRPGDRALLLYPPGLEFISAFFGCLYAQVVAVPAYPPNLTRPDRAAPRLRAIAADARPVAVLSTRPLMEAMEAMDTLTDASDGLSMSRQ